MHRDIHRTIRSLSVVAAAALSLGGAGCTILAALDEPEARLPACEEGDVNTQRDLVLVLDSFHPHIGNYGEVWAVSEGGFVTVRAALSSLNLRDLTLSLPAALPPGPHQLRVFFDYNLSGQYDAPPADHAWTLESCASGVYRLSHNPAFDDILDPPPSDVGEDFILQLRGFADHQDRLLEVRVVDQDAARARTVGYYRIDALREAAPRLRIAGMVEPGTSYTAAVWIDADGDLTYGSTGVDPSWRLDAVGDATGLELTLDSGAPFEEIDDLLRGEP